MGVFHERECEKAGQSFLAARARLFNQPSDRFQWNVKGLTARRESLNSDKIHRSLKVAHYGTLVEYGLHCLLHLVTPAGPLPEAGSGDDGTGGYRSAFENPLPSSRDLAEYQGLPPAYVAKIFTRLEKAGLVISEAGLRGGYRLARKPAAITVLDVVDALEGDKPLFRCREIRRDCVLYSDELPTWATSGLCSIHAVMRSAEQQMRLVLAGTTLADLAAQVTRKVPAEFRTASRNWFQDRNHDRLSAKKNGTRGFK
jgi:Rrf2 family protein